MSKQKGFTLIELLLVIGAIVVLIGILLPSLGRARKAGRTAVCGTHLRGLAQSMAIYAQEWNVNSGFWGSRDDMDPTYEPQMQNGLDYYFTWDYQFLARGGTRKEWLVNNGVRAEVDKLRYCPEAPVQPSSGSGDFRHKGSTGFGFVGESQLEWRRVFAFADSAAVFREHSGSYGFNGWLYQNLKLVPAIWNSPSYRWTQVQQKNGALVPVFVDCIAAELAPDGGDASPTDLNCPFDGLTSAFGDKRNRGELSSACIDRHGKRVNVAFFDAHVETVKLPDLWTLKWSANWYRTEPAVVPGPGK